MNITNEDSITEFYMFIHGPFATNIYLDIMAEVGGKVLTKDEEKNIEFHKDGTKADKELPRNLEPDFSDLCGLITDLVKEGFAREEIRKTIFFSKKKYYSITRKGIRKLNTLLIDASLEKAGLKKLKEEKHFREFSRRYPFNQE